ncbi:folate-binding protein YgfZ [Nitrosomonas sp. sh817]|uniref:CAF17-like 4Fe-4S cluster assembly/insertion protein YgfZ n=1 Tax=Nitrosomonas sp. sh817 TaxID=3070658 RepID=UPI0027DDE756|nr:folate-binding protein [Nitrosomonas sp. sh817]WMJ07361.1 folate-binding protein [Nitrosomonas sp. sh817]
MNTEWQNYLTKHSAVVKDDSVIHFGDSAAELLATETTTVISDLSHRGLIQFSGGDAKAFLQSQLSCDIYEIGLGTAKYGSYCTPKGRVLANFIVWQHGNELFMQLPVSMLHAIQKRLSLYVLRAKVTITDCSDQWIRFGIAGPDAIALVQEADNSLNDFSGPMCMQHTEKLSILYHSINRVEIITTVENAQILWDRLARHARPVGFSCWDWLEIQAGIPAILPETQEMFLPQMINLDAIGGVSFKKGCYPGQEIVARTQYLGKLKRRMQLVHVAANSAITAGDALYSVETGDQSSGNIVNAAPSPQGGFDALAVVQCSSDDASEIHCHSLQGPVLEFRSLPYPLPA